MKFEFLTEDISKPTPPAAGRITSGILKAADGTPRKLQYARIMVSANSNVTFKDYGGSISATVPLLAGVEYHFLVTEVTAASAGTVYLIHDGEIDETQDLA